MGGGVAEDVTLDAGYTLNSNGSDPALTIDTKDGTDTGALVVDLVVEGDLDGGSNTGLLVHDSVGSNALTGTITINSGGSIKGTTAINLGVTTGGIVNRGLISGNLSATGSDLNNTGTIASSSISVKDLINTAGGTITADSLNYTGTLTNSGVINTDGLTVAGNIDNTGGTLAVNSGIDMDDNNIILTDGELMVSLDTLEQLISGIGTLTVSDDSRITVSLDAELYEQIRGENDYILLDFSSISGTLTPDMVSAGSIFIDVSDVKVTGAQVTADLNVSTAAEVASEVGIDASSTNLAEDFFEDNLPGEQVITDVYGSIFDASGNADELEDYLDDIRPDDSGSAALTASQATTAAMGNILDRGANLRGVNFGDMLSSSGIWLQALYSRAKQEETRDNLGYKSTLKGFTLSFDRKKENQTFGIALSHGKSDVEFIDRDQDDQVKTYLSSFYHFWRHGSGYLDSSLSLGRSVHKGSRMKSSANLASQYDSNQYGAQVLAGWYLPKKGWMVEPMASLRWNHVKVEGYAASNSDGSLTETVSGVSYNRIEAGAGGAISKRWETHSATVTPRASLMIYHDFTGDDMDYQVNFAGNDYTVKGTGSEKTSAEARLAMEVVRGEHTTFIFGYTRVMKSGFTSNNFDARFRYQF